MSLSTRRESKKNRLLGDYPKFMRVALAAVCTTSALTINCGTSAMILSRASCRSMLRSRSLLSSMKMMTNSNKGQNQRKKRNVLALDFDGVVCASSVESSFSSIVAAEKLWPGVCKIMVSNSEIDEIDSSSTISSYSSISTEGKNSRFCRIRAAVNELRPIVETGFENMLLVRALNEELESTGDIDAASLMDKWSPAYRDELLTKYGTTKEELVTFFGKVRDDLIAENLDAWVGLNKVYPCVSDCLGSIFPKKLDYVIITTKQERFVKAILEKNVITPPVDENIYDLDNPFGAKTKVLAALLEKYRNEESLRKNKEVVIHFVEDRFETLLAVSKDPALDSVQLYLVDWGYNTPTQREEAMRMFPRIKLINGEEFKSLASSFIVS